jgi:SAM-dependent methyltransferase
MPIDSELVCVVCGTDSVQVMSLQPDSITTERRLINRPTKTLCCSKCGFLFNAAGARNQEGEFYAEQYDLHGESAKSEWQVFVDGSKRGENDAILEFVESHVELPTSGRVLEVGCGKGILLGKFLAKHSEWSACGVEPSKHAVDYFRALLPQVEIHEGPFHTAPFHGQTFDLVMTSGVIEHVPDVVEFLKGVRDAIAPGGAAYVGLPSFVAKPDDLLVYDHLTHFTPDSLDALYGLVGLQREARDARPDRVWLWDIVTPCAPQAIGAESVSGRAKALVERHVESVGRGFESFERMLAETTEGEVCALFGLGVLGLLAAQRVGGRAAPIKYALDDNAHLWGSEKNGLQIHGSKDLQSLGIARVFLSANPCYHQRMADKLLALGLAPERIYRWDD